MQLDTPATIKELDKMQESSCKAPNDDESVHAYHVKEMQPVTLFHD